MALSADADSKRWFPDRAEDSIYMTLALCGEVGELANEIKKVGRGTASMQDAKTRLAIMMEMADVFTYLLALSAMLGVDLEKAYYAKRKQNVLRYESRDNNGD
jgi:NTP pyrophosphatase (non-canonical NTP hydrolase)